MANRLRALFCDHLSMMRGKYLPASKIGDDASRFAQALFAVHYDRDLLLDAPGARARGVPGYGVALAGRRHSRQLGK